jgi:SSS family solute:Na+ symporter|tara:strand:+ start:18972 stop:20627 length:1656 start_codon:yes stop_codon:yes gene_type:complete
MGLIDWSILAIYLFVNLLVGFRQSKSVTTSNEFFLGNRSSPWWALGVSVMATYVSALSFLGGPAWAYNDGLATLAIHLNYPIVVFVCIVFFIPVFYRSNSISIYEYLEKRFGLGSRLLMSALFMATMVLGASSILTATSIAVSLITGLSEQVCIIILTTFVVFYTMLGGMNAVIWTDVIQGIVLVFGATIILGLLLSGSDQVSSVLSYLNQNNKLTTINLDFNFSEVTTIWAGVIAMSMYHTTVYGTNQFMMQRAMAAKTIGDAKKAYLMMGYSAFFLYFFFFFIGVLLFAHFEGEPFDQQNSIVLVYIQQLALPGLMGLVIAAILSASLSSTSSALNSLSTVLIVDFYKKFFVISATDSHYLRASRIFTIVWGIVLIPFAFSFQGESGSILEVLSRVSSYLVGAKLSIFLLAFFSKNILENDIFLGVFASLVALVMIAPFQFLEPLIDSLWAGLGLSRPEIAWPWYVVIATSTNVLVSWLSSLFRKKPVKTWHPLSIKGIRSKSIVRGTKSENDWSDIPGEVDRSVWLLLIFFMASIGVLYVFDAFFAIP